MKDATEDIQVPWSAYLLECADGSFYCGVARDVQRRLKDHASPKGAKYVRAHGGPSAIRWKFEFPSRTQAMRAEIWIKAQSRAAKLNLICGRISVPADVLSGSKKHD